MAAMAFQYRSSPQFVVPGTQRSNIWHEMKKKTPHVIFPKSLLLGVRLLEYEQPGSVTPAKHCQVRNKHCLIGGGSPWKCALSYKGRLILISIFPSQLRDLCDLLHVYVAPSQASDVAGEGLYVRRKVSRWFQCRWVDSYGFSHSDSDVLIAFHGKNDVKRFSGGLVCCFNGVRDRIYAGLFR